VKLGITGTRHGLSTAQYAALRCVLEEMEPAALLHGACRGADAVAIAIACAALEPTPYIIAYPCTLKSWTDADALTYSDEVFQPQPPLQRNRCIVRDCDHLLALPQGMTEEVRSGTWSTVRAARKAGRPITIVWPDGGVTEENPHA